MNTLKNITSCIFTRVMSLFGKEYYNFYNVRIIRDWQRRQQPTQSLEKIYDSNREFHNMYFALSAITIAAPSVRWEKERGDYWKTYEEFVANGRVGDCEDIAIYYYILLRNTGLINDNDLGLRVIKNPYGRGYHTVTVVYTDTAALIIDNGIMQIETDKYTKTILECDLFEVLKMANDTD